MVELDLHAAGGGIELVGRFVGSLKLVQCVIDKGGAVAGADVDGVLDRDFGQRLVGAVAHDTIGRAEDALEPIGGVGEGVLNGAAARIPVAVVGLRVVDGVGRAAAREILATGASRMEDRTQRTGEKEITGGVQQRINMQHIGDGSLAARALVGRKKFRDAHQ